MIRLLLRRDQGTDNLLMPAAIAAIAGLMMRAIEAAEKTGPMYGPDNSNPIWFAHNITVWAVLSAGLIGSHYWLRATRLHIALPLPARRLWLARMGSICIGCLLMVLVIALVTSIHPAPDGGLTIDGVVWLGSLRIAAAFLLLLMVLQAPSPSLRRLRTSAGYITYTAVMWLLGLLVLVLAPRSAWLAAPVAAAALLLGWRIWRQIPPAFLLESQEPECDDDSVAPTVVATAGEQPAAAADAPGRFTRNGGSRLLLHRSLWRMLHNHWLGWLFTVLMTIYGFLFTFIYHEGRTGMIFMFYLFVFGFGAGNQALLRVHSVDAWPLSRRLIFAHATLPLVFGFLLGSVIGTLGNELRSPPAKMVRLVDGELQVPYEFREIASDGAPPAVTAPWGETFVPGGTRLLPWGEAVVYSPYAIGPETSPRLDALQIDRAVAAVHGDAPPDPARYAELAVENETEASEACCGFDLEASRGRGSEMRAKTYALLAVAYCLVCVPLILIGSIAYDSRAHEHIRNRAILAAVVLPLGTIAAMLLSELFGGTRMWAQAAAPLIALRRLAETLPLPVAGYLAAAVIVMVASYLVLQERFVGLEASHQLVHKQKEADD
ncbi:hypothetical protein H8E07_07310 [bacterium]|nr:hypothetical protein [bacterium]